VVKLECKRCGGCCYFFPYKIGVGRSNCDFKLTFDVGDFVFTWCPFLTFEGDKAVCLINDMKPKICRDYCCKKCLFPNLQPTNMWIWYYK